MPPKLSNLSCYVYYSTLLHHSARKKAAKGERGGGGRDPVAFHQTIITELPIRARGPFANPLSGGMAAAALSPGSILGDSSSCRGYCQLEQRGSGEGEHFLPFSSLHISICCHRVSCREIKREEGREASCIIIAVAEDAMMLLQVRESLSGSTP